LWSLSISFISLQSTLPEFLSLFSYPIRGTVHRGPYSISFISLRSTLPEFLSLFSYPIRGTVHCGPYSISFISLRSTLPEFLSLFSHPIRGTVRCGPCPSALYPYKALFLSSCPSNIAALRYCLQSRSCPWSSLVSS
jgi:hypothetical protein